jgi:hypothetical protein
LKEKGNETNNRNINTNSNLNINNGSENNEALLVNYYSNNPNININNSKISTKNIVNPYKNNVNKNSKELNENIDTNNNRRNNLRYYNNGQFNFNNENNNVNGIINNGNTNGESQENEKISLQRRGRSIDINSSRNMVGQSNNFNKLENVKLTERQFMNSRNKGKELFIGNSNSRINEDIRNSINDILKSCFNRRSLNKKVLNDENN